MLWYEFRSEQYSEKRWDEVIYQFHNQGGDQFANEIENKKEKKCLLASPPPKEVVVNDEFNQFGSSEINRKIMNEDQ